MKEQQYIQQLENNLFELFKLLTDNSLYSFLSDSERKKVGELIAEATSARQVYSR